MSAARAAVLIALGSNLSHPRHGEPSDIISAAIRRITERGIMVEAISRLYRTPPVPVSDQPWYVNAVIAAATRFDPVALLGVLHAIEREFGRQRGERNAARVLDLDLLAHEMEPIRADTPLLPHPRLHARGFVLLPLCDVAPDWRHPVLDRTAAELLSALADEETSGICRSRDVQKDQGDA